MLTATSDGGDLYTVNGNTYEVDGLYFPTTQPGLVIRTTAQEDEEVVDTGEAACIDSCEDADGGWDTTRLREIAAVLVALADDLDAAPEREN